ncbi:MAG: chromate transporter [Candidatus Muiribacteriota bacterium]
MIYLMLFVSFFKIGLLGFGGGYAMITLIQDEARFYGIYKAEFIDLVALAEMTPGPIGLNVSTYTGYKIAGLSGAVVASFSNLLPSFILILTAFYLIHKFKKNHPELHEKFFKNFKIFVAGLIVSVVIIMADAIQIQNSFSGMIICIVSFLLCFFKLNPILVLILAGIAGYFIY